MGARPAIRIAHAVEKSRIRHRVDCHVGIGDRRGGRDLQRDSQRHAGAISLPGCQPHGISADLRRAARGRDRQAGLCGCRSAGIRRAQSRLRSDDRGTRGRGRAVPAPDRNRGAQRGARDAGHLRVLRPAGPAWPRAATERLRAGGALGLRHGSQVVDGALWRRSLDPEHDARAEWHTPDARRHHATAVRLVRFGPLLSRDVDAGHGGKPVLVPAGAPQARRLDSAGRSGADGHRPAPGQNEAAPAGVPEGPPCSRRPIGRNGGRAHQADVVHGYWQPWHCCS